MNAPAQRALAAQLAAIGRRPHRNQNPVNRVFSRQAFTDNARLTIDLPRDFDHYSLMIRVTGNAAVTTLYTAVRAEAPTQVVKSLTLKSNGSTVLDSMTGQMAHRLGMNRRGQLPPLTAPTAAAVATYPIVATYILDRANIDGIKPKDSAFPSRGLQTFQLELVMGACSDLFTGAGVGTITSGVVEISGIQLAEEPGADGSYSLPVYYQRRIQTDVPFASSNANYQHRVAAGAKLRGILMRTAGAVTAGEPSDAVVNNVKVMIGNAVAVDLPWNTLRAWNAAATDVTTLPTGYAFVDFMNMGAPFTKIADSIDLRAMPDISLYLDVTGAANNVVSIMPIEFVDYTPKEFGLLSG